VTGAISNARYYDRELGRFIQPDTIIPDVSNPQSKDIHWTNWAGYWLNVPPISTSTNALITNVFALGSFTIVLQVNDSIADGLPGGFSLQVSTASHELAPLIEHMRDFPIPGHEQRTLAGILSSAASLFHQGTVAEGCAELKLYQDVAKASRFDFYSTFYLLQPTQMVLDAFADDVGKPHMHF
jgi:hypothetical protein